MDISQYENYHKMEVSADPSFPYQTYLCSIPLDFIEVPLHWHEEMELIYIKKGNGTISVDFESYEVKDDDIVMVLPGQLHSIRQSNQTSMEYETIIFKLSMLLTHQTDTCTEDYLLPLLRNQISFPVHLTSADSVYTPVASCLDAIDHIRQTFPYAFELFIKGKLFEMFYGLFSTGAKTISSHTSRQNHMDKTKQILKYIEQHYAEKLSIETIAGTAGFSQSHFMKFFKSALGTSFIAYLNDYRLTMASRLLLASESSILDIAADTGFDNLSYFNRAFKKKFGMTPSKFRKNH